MIRRVDKVLDHVFRSKTEQPMSTVTYRGAMADGSGEKLVWYQDKRCESGACVEVAAVGDSVMVRSSANQEGTPVTLSRDEWREFLAGVKAGTFDRVLP